MILLPGSAPSWGKSKEKQRLGTSAPHPVVEPDVIESNARLFQTSAFC